MSFIRSSKLSSCLYTRFFASLSAAKKIAYLAVFIALSVVVNSFVEINITPSNKLTFTYFICFFAGFLLGPLPGFLVGFLGDAIGFLLVPQDVYWFFGLTLGLIGMIAGFARKLPLRGKRGVFFKALIAFAVNYIVITCFVNSLVNYGYLYLFIWGKTVNKTFWVYMTGRLAFQSVVFAINAVAAMLVLTVFVSSRLLGFFKDELTLPADTAVKKTPAEPKIS